MDGGDAAACEEADGSETTGGALQTDGSDAAACEEADGSETANGTLNAQRVQLAHVEARQVHFNICARMGEYWGMGGGAAMHTTQRKINQAVERGERDMHA